MTDVVDDNPERLPDIYPSQMEALVYGVLLINNNNPECITPPPSKAMHAELSLAGL